MATVALAPVWWRLSSGQAVTIRGQNDLPGALAEAEWSSLLPFRPPAPHFLLPALTRAVGAVVGLRVGMVLVCALAAGLTFAGIAAWGTRTEADAGGSRRAWETPSAAVAVGLLVLETPALLVPATAPDATPWWGRSSVADLHHWASPTNILVLACFVPLAALLVRATDPVDGDDAEPPWAAILALTVLAGLAKPSLTLPSLVAVPAFVAWRCGRTHRSVGITAAFWVPAAVATTWQVWFLRSGRSPFDSAAGWRFRPFWVFDQPGMDRPLAYAAMLLVPLLAWAGGRRLLADPLVRLLGLVWVCSWGPTLLLQETGTQAGDANFTVGTQLSYFLLAAAMLVRLAEQWGLPGSPPPTGPARRVPRLVLGAYLAAALAAGTWAYLDAIGVVQRA